MYVFKGLTPDAGSPHLFYIGKGKAWPLPGVDGPGAWVEIPACMPVDPSRSGFHFAKQAAVMGWSGQRNFLAEVEGEARETHECVVARRARLVRELHLGPRDWAELAVKAMADVLQVPMQVDYPWDQVRGVTDPYNIVVERFGFRGMEYPTPGGHRLSAYYTNTVQKHMLRALSEEDCERTVERGFNARGMRCLSHAAIHLLQLEDGGAHNWYNARKVAAQVREAAAHFAQGAEDRAARAHTQGIVLPASLKEVFRTAGVAPRRPAVEVQHLLMERQSRRLVKAWGL